VVSRPETPQDPLRLRDRLVAEARLHFEQGESEIASGLLRQLEFATIDESTVHMTDPFLRSAIARGKRIVASFDPCRCPRMDEVVVIYGNYPHTYENIVVNNPIKRHVASFWDLEHDSVEYDNAWENVEQIYILNVAHRLDRYDSILRELATARAPLQRITRIEAVPPVDTAHDARLAGTISCSQGHLTALRRAAASNHEHILVLEDDFCFTSDLDQHLADLRQFFARKYAYSVCLLATSKYGPILANDDLVSVSFQPCTNAAGYLVSRDGVEELLRIQTDALELLQATGAADRYAFDRSWGSLRESGMLWTFRRKFGFQVAGFSDIEGSIARYLD
jgi:hypothetical protein